MLQQRHNREQGCCTHLTVPEVMHDYNHLHGPSSWVQTPSSSREMLGPQLVCLSRHSLPVLLNLPKEDVEPFVFPDFFLLLISLISVINLVK